MEDFVRADGRRLDEMRPVKIELDVQPYAEGSALIEMGWTRVLCAVSVQDDLPGWLAGRGSGWLTAQYAMLPRATSTRNPRPGYDGRVKGRSTEIQRLIGRSLRATLDLTALGQRQLMVDCDVLVADGGTRCAAITGAAVAVRRAVDRLLASGELDTDPMHSLAAAVSTGLVDGRALLDLAADEDQRAEADFNLVFLGPDELVEIQGAAEKAPFDWAQVGALHRLARQGALELFEAQRRALEG